MNKPVSNLLKLLDRLHIDAAIIVSKPNKFYLTGYEYEEGYILIDRSGIRLVVDPRFTIYAKNLLSDGDVIESRQPAKELRRLLKRYRHIGVDGSSLLHRDFVHITSGLDQLKFCFIEQHLSKMRAIKNAHEVDYIKKAASIAEAGLKQLLSQLASTLTEKQIAGMLNSALISAGADDTSFDPVIAFDERAAYAHAIPSNTVTLSNKRLMLCDFGAVYKGYHSDETHTFFIKSIDKQSKKIYNIVLGAHNMAIDAVKAGIKASSLDKIAREFLDKHGYARYFGHALGHGVGLEVHESPSISYRSKEILEPGMIFTIEPGVYIPQWGGIRIESMIYLSDRGKEVITTRYDPVINLEV